MSALIFLCKSWSRIAVIGDLPPIDISQIVRVLVLGNFVLPDDAACQMFATV